MSKARWLSHLGRGGGWIFASKLLISLVAIAFAASISITSSTYRAETGSVMKFPTGMIATDKGFSKAPATVSAFPASCSSPATFGVDTSANTAITAGDLVYDVQVNATGGLLPGNTKFNVTLVVGSTTYGPVCLQTLLVLTGTIDCKFDVSTALPASPYTFKITIQ